MIKLLKYSFLNILKSRFAMLYTLFIVAVTVAIFQVDSDLSKVSLSLLNIILLVVPLISAVYATIYFYNSYEFIELMLAQPINRGIVFMSQIIAVGLSLSLAMAIGIGAPMLIYGGNAHLLMLLVVGVSLTLVFCGLAFLAAVITRDKSKAIGVALLFWIFFTLIYDGIFLYMLYSFSDYPLEKFTLIMVMLNPVDLARIIMLMQVDIAALMGYTGAFFQNFFGSLQGTIVSACVLLLWIALPTWGAKRIFMKKDL